MLALTTGKRAASSLRVGWRAASATANPVEPLAAIASSAVARAIFMSGPCSRGAQRLPMRPSFVPLHAEI
jgi:hypothetical protein